MEDDDATHQRVVNIWDEASPDRIQRRGYIAFLRLLPAEKDKLGIVAELEEGFDIGIWYDGSIYKICTLGFNWNDNLDRMNNLFNTTMRRGRLASVCMKKHTVVRMENEDENVAIFEPFKKRFLALSSEVSFLVLTEKWSRAKPMLAPLLGYASVYDPVTHHFPLLLDSLYETLSGEIKFLTRSLVEEVEEVEGAVAVNPTLDRVRAWILALSRLITFDEMPTYAPPAVLPQDAYLYMPLPVRFLFAHLTAYNGRFSDIRRVYFDVPFLHTWDDHVTFVTLLSFHFNCSSRNKKRNLLLACLPPFDWVEEISLRVDLLNGWCFSRQIRFALSHGTLRTMEPYDRFKAIEFFLNFLKHLFEDFPWLQQVVVNPPPNARPPPPPPPPYVEPTIFDFIPYPILNVPGPNQRVIDYPTSFVTHPRNVPIAYNPHQHLRGPTTHLQLVALIQKRIDLQGLLHQALCSYLASHIGELDEIENEVIKCPRFGLK